MHWHKTVGLTALVALGVVTSGCGSDAAAPSVAADPELPDIGKAGNDAPVALPEVEIPDEGQGDAELVEGGFGWPCTENLDCLSEWCVEGPDGNVCTKTCIDDCPGGFVCKGIANQGSDLTYICVAPWARLCWPCEVDSDCANAFTDPGARCVTSDAGGFCGTACGSTGFCPEGYACEDVPLGDDKTGQCSPISGECTCSPLATELQLQTSCQNVSANGAAVCKGVRKCTAEGLTKCDAAFPALEVCDFKDNDCDGVTDGPTSSDCVTWFPDTDGDQFGIGAGECLCEDPGPGFGPYGGDCNDLNANVNPDNPEICNFADDDCNGETDEGGALGCENWYPDVDLDGYGADAEAACICTSPSPDWIGKGGDCDDGVKEISPAAEEICDGVDNDCNGETDEENAAGCTVYYLDGDGDGFGQNESLKCLCAATDEYKTENGGDCNDLNDQVHPLAVEVCNGQDDNCDTVADEDGAVGCGILFKDVDEDGFGKLDDTKCFCGPQYPYTADNGDDCNDEAAAAKPGGVEICDGLDNDCNSIVDDAPPEADCIDYYADNDNDGFGGGTPSCQCAPDNVYKTQNAGDCNDMDPTAYPGAQETCAPADENCNTVANEPGALGCATFFKDLDQDGWGLGESLCVCADDPVYNASKDGDCYDDNDLVWPGQSGWFTKDRGDGSFDYDCSNSTEMKYTKTGGGCGGWPGCSTKKGWDNLLPNCGQQASWVNDCDTKLTSCKKESNALTQECH